MLVFHKEDKREAAEDVLLALDKLLRVAAQYCRGETAQGSTLTFLQLLDNDELRIFVTEIRKGLTGHPCRAGLLSLCGLRVGNEVHGRRTTALLILTNATRTYVALFVSVFH